MLRIALIQANLVWENPAANRAHLEELFKQIVKTDLIILPEMFTTGFSMNAAALAETMQGETMDWLAQQSKRLDAAIIGSIIITENGHFYNRLIFMRPDGHFETYDKRHLFAMANEHLTYTAGTSRLEIMYLGWRICPLICYDLRFPVWSRNTTDYDLLIYIANWPARRNEHWKALLHARAIENQAYTIGVNRVGTDATDLYYTGDTVLYSPNGDKIHEISDTEAVIQTTIYKKEIEDLRTRLPFLKDRD